MFLGDGESDDSGGGLALKLDSGNDNNKKDTLLREQTVEEEREEEAQNQVDIMAQQLKFVACLKILMEELSTLATGFEVDGKLFILYFIDGELSGLPIISHYFSNVYFLCFFTSFCHQNLSKLPQTWYVYYII